ncbi:DinB family protein [Ekhidna sp.]|uniref:DinB family protein n=1 Tax=Ekhidna sp. TaxID=2608089 RepID=UPI003298D665
MQASDFKSLFIRDLDRLMDELETYTSEESLWIKVDGINNSAGNLFMHLCGNLQHFIGAVLANSGYERKRDFEFNGRVTIDELKTDIQETKRVLEDYFQNESNTAYDKEYPLQPFGYTMTINYFLMHLLGHLNYHLGQINYHRRILSKT